MIHNLPCSCPVPWLPQDSLTPLIFSFLPVARPSFFPMPFIIRTPAVFSTKWREEPLRNLWADGTLSLNVSPLSPLLSTAFPFQALQLFQGPLEYTSESSLHWLACCWISSPFANDRCVYLSIHSMYCLFVCRYYKAFLVFFPPCMSGVSKFAVWNAQWWPAELD